MIDKLKARLEVVQQDLVKRQEHHGKLQAALQDNIAYINMLVGREAELTALLAELNTQTPTTATQE